MINTEKINSFIRITAWILSFAVVVTLVFIGVFYTANEAKALDIGSVKPSITYLNGNPYMGSQYGIFWASTIPDSVTYTDYQIKVNSTIHDFKSDGRDSYTQIYLVEYNGFQVGDNDISVRICDQGNCGLWSELKTLEVTNGWGSLCTVHLPTENKTVTANNNGTVYNVNPNSGVFTTDSDLETVAAFLGAPIGGTATLEITNNGSCSREGVSSVTKNGIATTPFPFGERKRLTNIICTSGCTGGGTVTSIPSGGNNSVNGTSNYCLGDPAPIPQNVTATALGSVYGKGPFTTGSNLGKIATYLGAPVGTNATLSIADAGCLNNYRSGTNNGITTTPWSSTFRGMIVTCTSGCGSGTTVGNTTNTTNTGNTINNLGISGDLSTMTYEELLNTLTILTNYLNNLVGSSGTTNTNTNTTNTIPSGVCLGDPAPASQTVTASNSPFEFVYGTGPFTTGSDLAKVAAYLGAPVGSEAKLQITDLGCMQNYNYTVQNGVTSIGWPAEWHGMNVVCTSGCTGSGSSNTSSGGDNTDANTSMITSTDNSLEKVVVMTEPVGFGVFNKRMGEQFSISWYTEGARKTNVNNSLFDTVQIKINSNIEQLSVNETFSNSAKDTFRFETQLVPYNGYETGDNNISVRLCKSSSGCGPWSDDYTLRVGGWISCGITAKPVTKTVTAKSSGIVYGGETGVGSFRHSDGKLYPYNVFGSESDFDTIATYLGAKVGTTATLEVSRGFHCPDKVYSDTKNGITTKTYSNITTKIGGYQPGVNIVCTSGCAGEGDDGTTKTNIIPRSDPYANPFSKPTISINPTSGPEGTQIDVHLSADEHIQAFHLNINNIQFARILVPPNSGVMGIASRSISYTADTSDNIFRVGDNFIWAKACYSSVYYESDCSERVRVIFNLTDDGG